MAVNVRGTMLVVSAISKAMASQEPIQDYVANPNNKAARSLGRGSIVALASISAFVPAQHLLNLVLPPLFLEHQLFVYQLHYH